MSIPSFCAICIRSSTSLSLQPLGRADAMVWVCSVCDDGRPTVSTTQRGYEPSGGLPSVADARRAVAAMDMPALPDFDGGIAYKRTPGYVIERVRQRDAMGEVRDRRKTERAAFADKPWRDEVRYLGCQRGFYIFERPDAASLARTRREQASPLAGIEQWRTGGKR